MPWADPRPGRWPRGAEPGMMVGRGLHHTNPAERVSRDVSSLRGGSSADEQVIVTHCQARREAETSGPPTQQDL
jgi:hypothetical protein